ncbi:carbonic anhydrase family protein [Nocardioides litoris]|uniref:carbonic anhydrase family protein n=1 Tax=Nocardioides litoris TaxID=1926648 RepID=UPI001476A25B|nr:carbonic anhydrase family protein [Nocardioides litoris]
MPVDRRSLLGLPLAAAGATAVARLATDPALGAVAPGAARPARQSPIDIRPDRVRRVAGLPPLEVHYARSAAVSVRYVSKDDPAGGGCQARGDQETEEVDVEEGAGHVTLAGHRWDLLQLHFHTRSEHTVDGRHFPLELHLVHQDAAERRLVIGVLLRPGRRSELDRILVRLPQECGQAVEVPDLDLASLVPRRPRTLRYRGSLTTDPYTEGVRWFLTVPRTTSRAGIDAFRSLFPDGDSRPTQPLAGRRVVADPGWHARR